MEVAVQPGHFVVQQMPHEALEVKEEKADQHLSQQAGQGGGLLRQVLRPQVPVQHGEREDEDQVVVERQSEAAPHSGPADGALRLQLEAPHQGAPGGQQVQQQEGQAEGQVDQQGEDEGEEGRVHHAALAQHQIPDRLQQHDFSVSVSEPALCSL